MPGKFTYKKKEYDWDTYVYNPITQRVCKRNARTVTSIISGKKSGTPHYIEEECDMPVLTPGTRIVDGKVRNPLTGNQINIDGSVYKKLIRAGWVQIPGRGLVQKDQVKILDCNTLPNVRTVDALKQQLSTMFANMSPPFYLINKKTGEKIELCIDSKDLKKTKIGGKEGPISIQNVIGAYLDQFSNDSDIHLISDKIAELDNNNFLYDYLICGSTNPDDASSIFAMSQDGYCVKKCLQDQFPDQNWDNIPDCCSDDDLQRIAVSRRLRIELYACFDLNTPVQTFGAGDTSNGGGILVQWSTQLNHVVRIPKNCKFASNNAPMEWFDSEQLLMNKFYELSMIQPVRPVFSSSNFISIFGFTTPDKQYKLKFEGYEKCPTAWSSVGVSLHVFHTKIPHDVQQKKLNELKRSIVQPGIHYNALTEKSIGYLYDQKRAYSSYSKCPLYRGFPDPTSPAYLLKSNTIETDILKKYEGFIRIKTSLTYPFETCLESKEMWVGFPQFLLAIDDPDNVDDIEIFEYLIMKRYIHDPFEHVIDTFKDDKSIMNKLFGALNKTERAKYDAALSADILIAWQKIHGAKYEQINLKISAGTTEEIDENRFIYKCIHSKIDAVIPDNAYIAAYINMYQKISMHMDLLSHLRLTPNIEILRIWVDGVVLSEKLPTWFIESYMTDGDRWKPVELTKPVLGWTKDFERHADVIIPEIDLSGSTFNPALIEPRVALIGPPGSGKTYSINNYWKNGRDLLLTGSTHLSANNLGGVTIHSIITECKKSPSAKRSYCNNYERIVVDEFTLLSTDQLTEILQIGLPVLFVGDFYQLKSIIKPPTREWLIENNFYIDELTKIQRSDDPITIQLYEDIRHCTAYQAMIRAVEAGVKVITKSSIANIYPKKFKIAHIVTAKNKLVDEYNLGYALEINSTTSGSDDKKYYDWATVENSKFNAPITIGMLVMGTNTVKNGKDVIFMNREIGIIEDIHYTRDGDLKNVSVRRINNSKNHELALVSLSKLRPGYAFTFHGLQGQTIKHPLIIDPINCFDQSMIYVAITRVTNLNLLSIVTINDAANYKKEWLDQIRDRAAKYKDSLSE